MEEKFWQKDITPHIVGTLAVFGLVISAGVATVGIASVGVEAQLALGQGGASQAAAVVASNSSTYTTCGTILPGDMNHEIGNAYQSLYFVAGGDTGQAPSTSTIMLFENGALLGPAHSMHADIRTIGNGRFSHWYNYLYFSSSDNSNPMINGRTYTYGVPQGQWCPIPLPNGKDQTAALQQWVDATPNGSTLVFPANATYIVNGRLLFMERYNLTWEGNGSTLKTTAARSNVPIIEFYKGTNNVMRNFVIDGGHPSGMYEPNHEAEFAVGARGVNGLELDRMQIQNVGGDCLLVDAYGPGSGLPSSNVSIHDSTCTNAGRMGVAVTGADNTSVLRNTFKNIAIHVIDCEPDYITLGCTNTRVDSNNVLSYGAGSSFTGWFFVAGVNSNFVSGLTITNNTVHGTSTYFIEVYRPASTTAVWNNVAIIGNTADMPGSQIVVRHVSNVTITNNANTTVTTEDVTVGNTPTCTISYTPSTLPRGQALAINWSSQNATSRTYSFADANGTYLVQNGGVAVNGGYTDATASQTLPLGTYTRTDIVTGPGGTAKCSANLTVVAALAPPPTCTISYTPSTLPRGQALAINWSSQNATLRSYSFVDSKGTYLVKDGYATTTDGGYTDATASQTLPLGTYTRTDVVAGPGGTATCSANLTVVDVTPPPATYTTCGTIDKAVAYHEIGNAYELPFVNGGDTNAAASSNVVLFENGALLGPAHSMHADIRTSGAGRFDHWYTYLYFSSSDNSNPLTNARTYTYGVPTGQSCPSTPTPAPTYTSCGTIDKAVAYHEIGNAYELPFVNGGDTNAAASSNVVLFENGALLGPAHSMHADIRTSGAGRFDHWYTYLYFSSLDNSNPLTNGKTYTWAVPTGQSCPV